MTSNGPKDGLRRRPTIRDVAQAAGVSRGTVSRVLNGSHLVSPEAAAAVEQAIKATGYTVNMHARSLVTGRSGAIAFLLAEPQDLLFENPVFPLMLRGATKAATALNQQMILLLADTPAERTRVVNYVAAGHVDGVLLISYSSSDPLLLELLDHQVPVVAAGNPLGYEGQVSSVATDDRLGGRQATEYLAARGCQRIATITGPLDTPGGVLRTEGYVAALGDDYDAGLVAHGDWLSPSGWAAMSALWDEHPDIDGVFAQNDLMAVGAIEFLRTHGIKVPEQVAVIGFDDSGIGEQVSPTLTTMAQQYEKITEEMLRLLLVAIAGSQPPTSVALPAELIRRESA